MKINEKNLIAFSIAPTTVHRDGVLLKQGENNRTFLKRWFVLKGNLLFYFEKRGDKEPIGVIIIEGCTIELAEHEEQVFCFRIVFPAREYVLAADSQESLEKWMKSLARASYTYLKLMVAELESQLKELDCAWSSIEESKDGVSGHSDAVVSNARHRLNPFNTAEENMAIVMAMEDDEETGHKDKRPRSFTVSGSQSSPSTPQLGSSTATSASMHSSSRTSISNPCSPPSTPPRPVPPKRQKKAVRANALLHVVAKKSSSGSDVSSSGDTVAASGSTCHCQQLGATSCSCCREYFLFQQLHMDYGAAILRDREMHRLLCTQNDVS
ncbi:PH domain-containing protein DDB_G0275795 isoform X1 [Hyalella azteca]|uniref:PH domain-containing protein DDB_G0275795 isoform X1 n=1 Tax=Hyalella azteca TaxID=294128 RepID=A0A8B7NYK0_HYAAZ|nr:PH domain-containing protein DDB_G0275795 isoform X1 [Hyalella azteca]